MSGINARVQQQQQPVRQPPPLLSRLYGPDRLLTLHQLLIKLSSASTEASHLDTIIVTEFDHPDYALHLLQNTYCVVSGTAPALRDGFSLAHTCTQKELIHRAIDSILRSASMQQNVLCHGYRKRRPSMGGQPVQGTVHTENYAKSNNIAVLGSPVWELLLSRIGDTLMLYLLLHVSLFSRLSNNCCLQLTGPPMAQVARNFQYSSAFRVFMSAAEEAAANTGIVQAAQNRQGPFGDNNNADLPAAVVYTQPDVVSDRPADTSNATANTNKKKRQRPSSWQRRKQRKLEEEALPSTQPIEDEEELPEIIPDSEEEEEQVINTPSRSQPPRPPLVAVQQEQRPWHQQRIYRSSNNTRSHKWPHKIPRPSRMNIPRNFMYCSTYSSKPGLPSKHLINRIQSKRNAARMLYSSIFNIKHHPLGTRGGHHSYIPPPVRRVPKNHRHILLLMQKMVTRYTKCPIGVLLNSYCPLPASLTSATTARRNNTTNKPVPAANTTTINNNAANNELQQQNLDSLMDEIYQLEEETKGPVLSDGTGQMHGQPAAALVTQQKLDSLNMATIRSQEQQQQQEQPSVTVGNGAGMSVDASRIIVDAGGQTVVVEHQQDDPITMDEDMMLEGEEPVEEDGGNPNNIPIGNNNNDDQEADGDDDDDDDLQGAENLAASFVPHNKVTDFIWAFLRRWIPTDMLGDKKARSGIKNSIRRFIGLRRYESANVHQLAQGINISGIPWLHSSTNKKKVPPNEAAKKQRMFYLWLGWLFSIVVTMLRSHFYCTESEAYRHQIFYYRKPVWAKLSGAYIRNLQQTQFTALGTAQAQRILMQRKLGVARLRLLPKRAGMRFIINMGRSSKVTFKVPSSRATAARNGRRTSTNKRMKTEKVELAFTSVNTLLQNVYQILKMEASRQPGILGSSMFGYNDIYCRIQPFIRRWKAALNTAAAVGADPSSQIPFIVSADVSRAFDHVDIDTILQLVEPLLQCDEYLVLKYQEVSPFLGGIKVASRRLAVPSTTQVAPFPALAAQWSQGARNKAFIDQVVYDTVSRLDVLSILRQHLGANLVKLRRQWHYQSRGIPQGSTLSTLLCSLYLAHVERTHIMPIIAANTYPAAPARTTITTARSNPPPLHPAVTTTNTEGGITALGYAAQAVPSGSGSPSAQQAQHATVLPASTSGGSSDFLFTDPSTRSGPGSSTLLRLVDDWLLITSELPVAQGVALNLLQGFPYLNIKVNPSKTKLSFPMTSIDGSLLEPTVYKDASGAEFIKWCGLLINVSNLEIQGDYTRYVGEHISSSMTIPLGRQPGAVLGQKICHYLRPKIHPLLLDPIINSSDTVRLNIYQAFMLGAMKFHSYICALPAMPAEGTIVLEAALDTGISFMYSLTRPRRVPTNTVSAIKTTVACTVNISKAHIRYLGLHAFRRVLTRKQARYTQLLSSIEEALKTPACLRCAKQLQQVVHINRSSVFKDIQY